MIIAIFGGLEFLLIMGLVLFTVLRLQPEIFRLRATLTKWVSLDLEVQSKAGTHSPTPGDHTPRHRENNPHINEQDA